MPLWELRDSAKRKRGIWFVGSSKNSILGECYFWRRREMKGIFYFVIFLMITMHCVFGQAESKLSIAIEGPRAIRLGQGARYALVVKNVGTGIAKDVMIRGKIPAGMEYKNRLDGLVLRWNLGSLAAKERKVVYYHLDAPKVGSFENIGIVYVNEKVCDEASIRIRVMATAPVLKITISNPRRASVYRAITNVVTITNEGDASACNLKIIATLPHQVNYIRSTPRGLYCKGKRGKLSAVTWEEMEGKLSTVTWKIPEIKAGSKIIIRIMNRINVLGVRRWRCRFCVKLISNSEEPVIPTMEAFSSLGILSYPKLHISSYDTEDPCELGRQTIYFIECMNEGTSPTTNLRLNNYISKEMEYIGAKGPTPHGYKDGVVYFKPVPILQPGEKLVYIIICRAIAPGTAKNIAVLRYKQSDVPLIDKEKTSIYKPRKQSDVPIIPVIEEEEACIVIEGPKAICQGQVARYALVVKNIGMEIAKDVMIRVKIPAGMKYKDRSDGFVLCWNLGSLAAKEGKVVYYDLKARKVGNFENIGIVYVNGKACDKAKIKTRVIAPVLKITIDNPRRTVRYRVMTSTITIMNEGDVSVRDLKMIATLPRAVDYIRSKPRGLYRKGRDGKLSTVTWKIPEMKAGSKKIMRFISRAKLGGRCRFGAQLISDNTEPTIIPRIEAFSSLKIIGFDPVHISSYDTKDPCKVGQETIYIIECMNEGSSPTTNIIVNNHISKEMKYIGAKGPTPHSYKDGIVYFKPVPILQPGEKITYRVKCKAITPGSAKNIAVMRYKQFDRPIIDEEKTSVYK